MADLQYYSNLAKPTNLRMVELDGWMAGWQGDIVIYRGPMISEFFALRQLTLVTMPEHHVVVLGYPVSIAHCVSST